MTATSSNLSAVIYQTLTSSNTKNVSKIGNNIDCNEIKARINKERGQVSGAFNKRLIFNRLV